MHRSLAKEDLLIENIISDILPVNKVNPYSNSLRNP
jgi:hypothetical protein